MFTSRSGISSKRISGFLGWMVIIAIILYCVIQSKEAPAILETFIYACIALLGIDSVTAIWKNNNNSTRE